MRLNVFATVMVAAASVVPALAWDDSRYVSREEVLDVLRRLDTGHSAMRRTAVESPAYVTTRSRSESVERDLNYYQERAPSTHLSRDDIMDIVLRDIEARDMEARGFFSTLKNKLVGGSKMTFAAAPPETASSSTTPFITKTSLMLPGSELGPGPWDEPTTTATARALAGVDIKGGRV